MYKQNVFSDVYELYEVVIVTSYTVLNQYFIVTYCLIYSPACIISIISQEGIFHFSKPYNFLWEHIGIIGISIMVVGIGIMISYSRCFTLACGQRVTVCLSVCHTGFCCLNWYNLKTKDAIQTRNFADAASTQNCHNYTDIHGLESWENGENYKKSQAKE